MASSPLRLMTSIFFNWILSSIVLMYHFLGRGWVCRLQLLLVLASAVILRSESRGTHDHILLPQIRDSPNSEVLVSVFTGMSSRNRVAQLYSQALGSLFVAAYDSQG
jgi:hypothetical protein